MTAADEVIADVMHLTWMRATSRRPRVDPARAAYEAAVRAHVESAARAAPRATPPASTAFPIRKVGRRYYVSGDTYPHRSTIKAAGLRWDPDERAWWTGKQDLAEQVSARLASLPRRAHTSRADSRRRPVYRAVRGRDFCGYPCPVNGHRCTADHPCHDCE